MIRGMRIIAAIALCGLVARGDDGADAQAKNGSFTLTFTDRSDQATNAFIATRMGWTISAEAAAKLDYTLAEESFEVYVPPDYTEQTPFGLLVFIMPGGRGGAPENYRALLDKYHLIYVGPNKAGNDRVVGPRMALAIDAAANMRARYKIDPNRVYVSGISGGGRVASMLGVGFPDVFRGGFYIIGCNFYHDEKAAEPDHFFKRSYNVPPAKFYNMARKQSKHVFLTGDNDGNREQTEIYYKAFKRDGFEHITYLQVPGMGHQSPNVEWFEKGLVALDETIATPAAAAKVAAPKPATRPAPAATSQPAEPTDPKTIAQRLLVTAKLYVDNKQYERGREKLAWIVQHYPETPAAAEAKKMLSSLAGKE
jgi:poly(3-hydroxybutyrate) depolymerase